VRTTLTLDPDVAARLDKEVARGKQTFKEIVNAALRRGLDGRRPATKRFVQRTWDGGPLPPWDQIKETLYEEDVERYT